MTITIQGVPVFHDPDQLAAKLSDLVNERSATAGRVASAVERAISELSGVLAYSICDDNITIDGSGCGLTMPCCGIVDYELWVRQGCPDCYEHMHSSIECGKIRTTIPMKATGKLIIYGRNEYSAPARTIGTPAYDDTSAEWTIYLDGQPDIPPFGFCSICDDVYFYYCKAPRTWTQDAGVTEADYMYTGEDDTVTLPEESHGDPDFSTMPGYQPTGIHTALTLVTSIQCGRGDEVSLPVVQDGTVVSFPLAYTNAAHVNAALYCAAEHLYVSLIGSCRSPRDIERFTGMNEYYEQRKLRALSSITRVKAKRITSRHANNFRSNYPLHSRWPWPHDGRFTGVGCCF